MWKKYHWERTKRMSQLLTEIEALKMIFQTIPSLPAQEEKLRRIALLKSAVYSARIEGGSDTEADPRKESQNLLAQYRSLYFGKFPKKLTTSFLKKLHREVLSQIAIGGSWRQEPWAVFNQAGIAIHIAPNARELPILMDEYTDFINGFSESIPIKAAIAQFIFEKIHPLPDGNGRVGRLISSFVLYNGGYGFRGQIPLEEYIEHHRETYYEALVPSKNATQFIEFSLTALVEQGKMLLQKLNAPPDDHMLSEMLPRREEIYRIINDHPNCSFDFMRRRFMSVSSSTLHRDIAYLMKQNLVQKRGSTSGAVYLVRRAR